VAKKKPAASSTANLETHSAARLERLSRQIGVSVNDKAVDRILATIDISGTSVLLPGIDAANLDAATTAEIKRLRWGGSVRSMLSFLGAIVHLRKLNIQKGRREVARLARAFAQTNDREVALALTKMALEQAQAKAIDARAWSNERIAGEFLPQQYWLFGKEPTMTRGGETVRFIQAVLRELRVPLSEESSIIRAMQAAKEPRRRR
jgi:hypothetical protein